jgi:hypothetical protein
MGLFRKLCVNRRVIMCGAQEYAAAQTREFLLIISHFGPRNCAAPTLNFGMGTRLWRRARGTWALGRLKAISTTGRGRVRLAIGHQ